MYRCTYVSTITIIAVFDLEEELKIIPVPIADCSFNEGKGKHEYAKRGRIESCKKGLFEEKKETNGGVNLCYAMR